MHKDHLAFLLAGCATATIALADLPARAQGTPAGEALERHYNIPKQPLGSALNSLAGQSGQQIMFDPEVVRGKESPALQGSYTPAAALNRLLAGSGLAASTGDGGILLVKAPSVGEFGAEQRPARSAAAEQANNLSDSQVDQEIVVTGTNVRGARVAAPITTITREDIERSAYSTTEDLFRDLPQNFSGVTPGSVDADVGARLAQTNRMTRAASVDLRGLGAQSTLVLFNGQRLAGSNSGQVVDVSAIPLSVIDRVEVITGGSSAIYGADAVAGVVNLITRRELDGLHSYAFISSPLNDGGGRRVRFSQSGGISRPKGGFIAAYDYQNDASFDVVKTGLTAEVVATTGASPIRFDVQPNSARHSFFFAGRYDVSDALEIQGHALISEGDLEVLSRERYQGADNDSFVSTSNRSSRLSISYGLDYEISPDWILHIGLGGGRTKERLEFYSYLERFTPGDGTSTYARDLHTVEIDNALDLSSMINGKLPAVFGVSPRMAAGVSVRKQRFSQSQDAYAKLRRSVYSASGEVVLPFGHRLPELSLAGRYDRYSDFGDVFNPQLGVIWDFAWGARFRSTYARSYRAPALAESLAQSFVQISAVQDPQSPTGSSYALTRIGAAELAPETAHTWTLGLDLRPTSAPALKLSTSYFNVRYKNRIDTPAIGTDLSLFLERPGFDLLVDRSPSADMVAEYISSADDFINGTRQQFDPSKQNALDVFPRLLVFDNRTSNLAEEWLHGFDASADYSYSSQIGEIAAGIDATLVFSHRRKLTETSPTVTGHNEIGKPVDFRFRSFVGWNDGPFGVSVYLNYTDGYNNPRSTPESRIESWTTTDITVNFDGSKLNSQSWISNISLNASIKNLLNKEPPLFANSTSGLKYDAANATPFGRMASLSVSVRW